MAARTSGIWTPANIVTCIRVAFVPVWLLLAETVGGPGAGGMVSFVAFCLLSLTDKLDGYLARSRGEVTDFGKFLDPIADKLVVIVALCYLLEWGLPISWVLLVVVAREFLVSGLRMVVASKGTVIAASGLGKWKTATTMFSICGLLLTIALDGFSGEFVGGLAWMVARLSIVLLVCAVVLTVWSGIDYFVKAWPALTGEGSIKADADAGGPAATRGYASEEGSAAFEKAGVSELAPSWDECVSKAAHVLEAARGAGLTLGSAESCTGGLVEGALTAVPGSSDVVMGAVGSYACSVKTRLLGVEEELLAAYGAVSSECARSMAEGARAALGCDVAVSVTGIAGPGGGSAEKPVGLVWFAVSRGSETRCERMVFEGSRAEVRLSSVSHALGLLEEACRG